jgi:TonB family protein
MMNMQVSYWMVGAWALLNASAAASEARPGWLVISLPNGAEFAYLPVAVTLKDYPKQALWAGEEGTSLLNLQVDRKGRVKQCTTARSSGSPLLDEQACRLYRKRGRFKLRGMAGPLTVQAPVRWMLVD